MDTQSQAELNGQKRMFPPPPGMFHDREELIKHVRDFGASEGYVVTIKKSRKDRRVILGCDRGGIYRNRRKIDESKRKRKACSRLINCPFEAVGKKEDDAWVLTIKNGEHNHEPLKDMSEHPYSRRFTEEEVRQIKLMTEAGIKPRQVLKALKQSNPELQSTPRHLYNLKAKIRQGNLSEKSFKSWRPSRSVPVNSNGSSTGELLKQNNQPMFPIAVTCGNTFVLKPCEKNPGASMILAALAKEAGLPDGVLNIVHGTNDIVNYICDDEDIKAISFVGSNTAGMHIYARAAARGKRVQSNVGGNNHAIIMSDASIDATLNALVAGAFGAAGQRCMGLTTAVFVGGSIPWERGLMQRAKALKVTVGSDPGADVGPVISKEISQVKDRINRLVQSSVDNGARLLLDGRNIVVPGYENGNFIGPTIICDVASNMEWYKEEMFGPVLLCMQVESLEEAITIVNRNKSVNGAFIFTTSGYAARMFQNEIESGLVGINVPVPIPMSLSSLNGPKTSFAGDLNFCGKSGVDFYTQIKVVAQQWRDLPSLGASSGLHLSSETEMTSRGVSSALPPSTERDSPYQRVSPAMSPESEGNSPNHAILLSITATSERDLSNPAITSLPPTADGDLPNHGASLVIPPTADMDLESQDTSRTMPLGRDQSERIYTPQTSRWNETTTLASQRTESVPPPSERIYIPITSQRNSNAAPTVHRSDTATGLTHERVFVPISHKNDSMVMVPISHRSESMSPTSERIYMMATSHLSDSMGQTFQRTDAPMFPTSERIYVPATPHRTDHMGSTSRADVALRPASERLYMPATSQRNDSIAPASHQTDTMPQNSQSMYMPRIVQRNAGMPTTSERLYMPATSQRMFAQNTIISMDDYPNQGPPMNLPASQRI
ncbi:uncharacterized protein LOC111291869 isoform X5 [Durio zibethinus]|uniref:methylmalonate-semialdehyde dehydrogenase (CoA acylating) n=1 Tax=Durio zibethinus TaxID=66656 RepID=A0A6P5YH93_DURZI|nr:uncharacterized protein LOC111291869 isoform X5 [Durio zibethinus]